MKTNDLLKKFAKGKATSLSSSFARNAVIYTRVSTKEQAENNQSLDIQRKYCLDYAIKNKLSVLEFFGGTYESAKTDERNEFNRMMKFVRTQKEGVSHILVYSLDRFSRTGDNAIFISSQLKKLGISIVSVTQPIDVSTHSGILQQNIQFIFSKYDNDLRKEKCMAGMKEKLLKGEWIGCTPIGYSYDHSNGKKNQTIVFSDRAELIRKAFHLKATEGLTNTEISIKLSTPKVRLSNKRLTEIFRNPFYCGYISHCHLDGQLVKGKHQPLITKEIFLKANDMLSRVAYGFKHQDKNINIPLKNFTRCGQCGLPMTGYVVKAKQIYYYKCNTIGCGCNKNARAMNEKFGSFLKSYQVDRRFIAPLRQELLATYKELTFSSKENRKVEKQAMVAIEAKLAKVEERYAFGEIDHAIYERVGGRLKEEIKAIEAKIEKPKNEISNPAVFVDKALEICSNLSNLWVSGGYDSKRRLQQIVFPEGIVFDKQNDDYRTIKVNVIIELIHSLSGGFENKNAESSNFFFDNSASVPKAGIEPAHLTVHDFESCASTSSATQAFVISPRHWQIIV
jgi:site-specific DNA recombinase